MDGCSVDASIIRIPTDVVEGSDDAFNSAHGVGDDAHRSSEECCDNEEIHSENDSEDGDTRPFQDADQDPSSGTEGDSGDDLPGDRTSVPSFDESQLLARCIADFGTKTLPGSATTIAVAVVLIMSFIAAHGLPWSAVDDLLKLVEALFGFQKCGLPQSKCLLRKLWSAKCDSVSTVWQAARHFWRQNPPDLQFLPEYCEDVGRKKQGHIFFHSGCRNAAFQHYRNGSLVSCWRTSAS
ncbi:hypothetical protein MTO96_045129 [Rhipicephalus appendiculatus]